MTNNATDKQNGLVPDSRVTRQFAPLPKLLFIISS
jgi:hypothetical protein